LLAALALSLALNGLFVKYGRKDREPVTCSCCGLPLRLVAKHGHTGYRSRVTDKAAKEYKLPFRNLLVPVTGRSIQLIGADMLLIALSLAAAVLLRFEFQPE